MEIERLKYVMTFLKRIMAWSAVYAFISYWILYKIENDYSAILNEKIAKQSIHNYEDAIIKLMVVIVILSFFWWFTACTKMDIRRWFEENTILAAAIFIIVIIAADIIIMGNMHHSISDGGHEYFLWYSYSIYSAIIFNIFGLPPKTVQKVIFFGNMRWVLATLAGISAVFFLEVL